MGKPWYINADDEASDLVETIERPALVENGVTIKARQAVDLSAVTLTEVEYWTGSAWTAIAGTGAVTMLAEQDGDGNNFYEASFTRSTNATAALDGQYNRRWVFTSPAGELRVPERGFDVMVVQTDPS